MRCSSTEAALSLALLLPTESRSTALDEDVYGVDTVCVTTNERGAWLHTVAVFFFLSKVDSKTEHLLSAAAPRSGESSFLRLRASRN